jgi:hypothetical protein
MDQSVSQNTANPTLGVSLRHDKFVASGAQADMRNQGDEEMIFAVS